MFIQAKMWLIELLKQNNCNYYTQRVHNFKNIFVFLCALNVCMWALARFNITSYFKCNVLRNTSNLLNEYVLNSLIKLPILSLFWTVGVELRRAIQITRYMKISYTLIQLLRIFDVNWFFINFYSRPYYRFMRPVAEIFT